MDYLKLTSDKLSIEDVSEMVVDEKCGAVSLFVGTTRDNFDGKKVIHLEYEAYEKMAINALKAICNEVREKWPDVHGIAMYHRLGSVPCKEASVVIAVSSPHRQDSLNAVSYCIDQLKATVPIWKKEVYEGSEPIWKENKECSSESAQHLSESTLEASIDNNLVQINVSNEELEKRIKNFIERKRDQVNLSNIQDFIPGRSDHEGTDTCARVRTQFVKRSDSKGHLKIRKVHNEWGPQTVQPEAPQVQKTGELPSSISERVCAIESYLNTGPVAPDIYKRLKAMEDKINYLQSISPEYSLFWKNKRETEIKEEPQIEYTFTADDIAKKIEMMEGRPCVEYSDRTLILDNKPD